MASSDRRASPAPQGRIRRMQLLLILIAPAAIAQSPSPAHDPSAPRPPRGESRTAIGLTSPRRVAPLAAVVRGRIARIDVREGDAATAGTELARLDDTVERGTIDILRARAESSLESDLARVRWDRAAADLRRLETLRGSDSASTKEYDDARSTADSARLGHQIALLQNEINRRELERSLRVIEQHRIVAPFDGYVADITHPCGAVVDEGVPVLTLVELDTLVVAADCPIDWAGSLRAGDAAELKPESPRFPPRRGTITFASRAGDAASQTFKVKIEVDNRDHAWVGGLKVRVSFDVSPAQAMRGAGTSNGAAQP